MFYVLTYSRPIGVAPTIYTFIPDLSGFHEEDPMLPSIEEFTTEFEARLYITSSLGKVKIELISKDS